MEKFVKEYFEKIKITVAFKLPDELGSHFPFKDKLKNKNAEALIVYKIKCKHCEACYIGKTKRIIITRLEEHKNIKIRLSLNIDWRPIIKSIMKILRLLIKLTMALSSAMKRFYIYENKNKPLIPKKTLNFLHK